SAGARVPTRRSIPRRARLIAIHSSAARGTIANSPHSQRGSAKFMAASSWQAEGPGRVPESEQREQKRGRSEQERPEVAVFPILDRVDRRALHAIDLGVDVGQGGRIGGAEETSAGAGGDLAQRGLVDVHAHHL